MKDSYFILNNNTYILSYIDFNLEVFKFENDQKVPVPESEKEMIKDLFRKHNSYIYSSRGDIIVDNNPAINNDQYAINTIELVESRISEELRGNLYRNLETLKMVTVDALDRGEISNYNAANNVIRHLEGEDTRTVTRAIVHDLFHVASSNYDSTTQEASVGYDSAVGDNIYKQNRGLTEGFTELLSLGTIPVSEDEKYISGYPIETAITSQLTQIIDVNTMLDAYFTNKGTEPLEKELNDLIPKNPNGERDKAISVFRNLEAYHRLSNDASRSNFLGLVQSDLIDYFDQKLELALANRGHEIDDITGMINRYNQTLITEEMLINMGEDINKYDGIRESVEKFQKLKEKYIDLIGVMALDENIIDINPVDRVVPMRRAGFGSMLLLGVATTSISIAILLLGMWIGR